MLKDVWAEKVWPHIQADYESWSEQRPTKQDSGAVGAHYGSDKVFEMLKQTREARNITCNLTWLKKLSMSSLSEDLVYDVVEKYAVSVWCQPSAAADEKKRKFPRVNMPSAVPRGLNIPVAVRSLGDALVKGEMQRNGLDVVVESVWLVLAWATQDGDNLQRERIRVLVLNWPFDFQYFDDEEGAFLAECGQMAAHETNREFMGMSGRNLVKVVMRTRELLREKTPAKTWPEPEDVSKYLTEKVPWGALKPPSTRVVGDVTRIGTALREAPRAAVLCERAQVKFGRNTIFDDWSKMQIIDRKTHGPEQLSYVMEGLYSTMLRENQSDPASQAELKSKTGPIQVWLWNLTYTKSMEQKHPEMFGTTESKSCQVTAGVVGKFQRLVRSPLAMYEEWAAPGAEKGWASGSPTAALTEWTHHVADLYAGVYNATIRGSLWSLSLQQLTPEKLHESEKVKIKFAVPFAEALKKTIVAATSVAAVAAATGEPASSGLGSGEAPAGAQEAAATKEEAAEKLKEDTEAHVRDRRKTLFGTIARAPTHQQLRDNVAATELFKSLDNGRSRFVGFYDVKNAKLARIYSSQSWNQREPALDREDFSTFVVAVNSIMKAGVDMVWVFSGTTRGNTDHRGRARSGLLDLEEIQGDLRLPHAAETLLEEDARCGKQPVERGCVLVLAWEDAGRSPGLALLRGCGLAVLHRFHDEGSSCHALGNLVGDPGGQGQIFPDNGRTSCTEREGLGHRGEPRRRRR